MSKEEKCFRVHGVIPSMKNGDWGGGGVSGWRKTPLATLEVLVIGTWWDPTHRIFRCLLRKELSVAMLALRKSQE